MKIRKAGHYTAGGEGPDPFRPALDLTWSSQQTCWGRLSKTTIHQPHTLSCIFFLKAKGSVGPLKTQDITTLSYDLYLKAGVREGWQKWLR